LHPSHEDKDSIAESLPDGKRVAYFRGRKLHGKALRVPEGYRGVVVNKTEPPQPQAARADEPEVVDLDAEGQLPLGTLEIKAEFGEIVIWGHESLADPCSDPYARGVEEWVKVAEKVREWNGKGECAATTLTCSDTLLRGKRAVSC
jgi:ribonuclease H2 subunit C